MLEQALISRPVQVPGVPGVSMGPAMSQHCNHMVAPTGWNSLQVQLCTCKYKNEYCMLYRLSTAVDQVLDRLPDIHELQLATRVRIAFNTGSIMAHSAVHVASLTRGHASGVSVRYAELQQHRPLP